MFQTHSEWARVCSMPQTLTNTRTQNRSDNQQKEKLKHAKPKTIKIPWTNNKVFSPSIAHHTKPQKNKITQTMILNLLAEEEEKKKKSIGFFCLIFYSSHKPCCRTSRRLNKMLLFHCFFHLFLIRFSCTHPIEWFGFVASFMARIVLGPSHFYVFDFFMTSNVFFLHLYFPFHPQKCITPPDHISTLEMHISSNNNIRKNEYFRLIGFLSINYSRRKSEFKIKRKENEFFSLKIIIFSSEFESICEVESVKYV